jgi:prolyl oligopeptidase
MSSIARRALLLAACLIASRVEAASPAGAVQTFFREAFEEQLRDNPEAATAIGRHDYDDRWSDWSPRGRERVQQHREARLRQATALSTDGLGDEDRLSIRLFRYATEQDLAANDLETHLLRVQPLYGLHTRVFLTIDRMPLHSVREYENVIARLRGVPRYVSEQIAILDEAVARGLTQPAVVVDIVARQIEQQESPDAQHSALTAAFWRFPANVPPAEQQRLRDAAVAAYEQDFLPAWKRLREYVAVSYRAKARAAAGIGSLADGRAAYQTLIRRLTTTNRTPEEIHELGVREVARIESAMTAVMRETGFEGTLAEFGRHLDESPEQHFKSKDEMLVYCRNIAKIIEPELPNQFKRIPVLLFGVRAIPADREQGMASNAQPPTADGSTPGWFNLNTYQPEKQFRMDKQALTLHEAVPGHVFQGAVARSIAGLPEFRKYYANSAYNEGWALYAESLGSELGLYRDPYSRYGQLSSERFRAVRLVVDTGIHAFGWTREQALDYFKQHAPDETAAEIDRYISWPAQALAYKLGQLEIRALRAEAEATLGARFDVREFHDALLSDGVLPLELLHEQVERYIHAGR